MTATFADHRAFAPGRQRSLQVEDLNDIRAVLPLEASAARLAVWRAMQDAAAVPNAMRALDALPEAVRREVVIDAEHIARVPRRRA